MEHYECQKCGCTDVYAKPSGRRIGLYCNDCNTWICWTTYAKMRDIYKTKDESELNDKVALKKIFKRSGITTMRCSKCDCLLYNSCKPKAQGQFNLVNAKFCPKCGRELL